MAQQLLTISASSTTKLAHFDLGSVAKKNGEGGVDLEPPEVNSVHAGRWGGARLARCQ